MAEQLRILHVDDDPEDLLLAEEALVGVTGSRMTITPAQTVEAARALVQTHEYDAILMDYSLGADTGGALVASLRKAGLQTPVIFLTGMDDPDVLADILRAGGDDYMSKQDLAPRRLVECIDRLNAKHRRATAVRGRERRLLASGGTAERILKAIPMAVVAFDEHDQLIHANRHALAILDDPAELLELLPTELLDRSDGWREGVRIRGLEGHIFDYGIARMDDLTVITLRDVSPRLAADKSTRMLHKALGERKAALAEVTSCVGHDMRGHLRRLRQADLSREGREKALDELDKIMGELVDYSRLSLEEQKPEAVDLNAMLSAALGILESTIPGIRERVTSDDLPTVMGDPLQMRQLLYNLIQNSHRHGGHSSRITVKRQGDSVLVRDDGGGVAPELRSEVFKPFRVMAGREVRRSSGIGLASARRIMQINGGDLDIDDDGVFRLQFAQIVPEATT